ncbi:MAG: hypothetical protein MR791_01105 [Bacteroidales bacterium]|nr:hypothetical protein [Bacteroidales bacterium]
MNTYHLISKLEVANPLYGKEVDEKNVMLMGLEKVSQTYNYHRPYKARTCYLLP